MPGGVTPRRGPKDGSDPCQPVGGVRLSPHAPAPRLDAPAVARRPGALGLGAIPRAAAAEPDGAFEALRTAPDEAGAALVEARIRSLWAQSASPSVTLLLRRGARDLEAQLPAEALEDLDAAITLQPDLADGWYLRAQAYVR